MCYSRKISLYSFLFGLCGSIALINLGKPEYKKSNKAIGLFYIYIAFVQFMEYLMWIDTECKSGVNKFASALGPFMTNFQPLIMLAIVYYYLDSNNIINNKIVLILAIVYLVLSLINYYNYLNSGEVCTEINENRHLEWNWPKYDYNIQYPYYHLLMLVLFINFYHDENVRVSTSVVYLFLFMIIIGANKNFGELWCLTGTGIPLITLAAQYM